MKRTCSRGDISIERHIYRGHLYTEKTIGIEYYMQRHHTEDTPHREDITQRGYIYKKNIYMERTYA